MPAILSCEDEQRRLWIQAPPTSIPYWRCCGPTPLTEWRRGRSPASWTDPRTTGPSSSNLFSCIGAFCHRYLDRPRRPRAGHRPPANRRPSLPASPRRHMMSLHRRVDPFPSTDPTGIGPTDRPW